MDGGARGGVAVSPKAHSSSSVETRTVSFVEQEGVSPLPKDRGAEQGRGWHLECSLALVAAEVRGNIVARASGGNPLLDWRQ